MSVPPFTDKAARYDLSSFMGRTWYWADALNPSGLLSTTRSLQKDQMLLDLWKEGHASVPDAELWRARRCIEQAVHPTSGEVIPAAFRMCAFLPTNYFIVPFMMNPGTVTSVGRTLFIQWFNQSYNSAVNYANRSSDAQPMGEIAKAYTAAVAVACGGSLGATMLLKRVTPGTTKATVIRGTVPFLAVSSAAVVNLACMRKSEWMTGGTGIKVKDEDGTERGYSTVAGKDSLIKCSIARIVWNAPAMVLPTLCMVPILKFVKPARSYPLTTETLLQLVALTFGMAPALALFDVHQTIPAASLEPQFQGLTRRDGSPVVNLRYYKGL